MSKHGGFEYVVAALNLKVTKTAHKKSTGRKERSARKPDGNVRSATKFILLVLANHRNSKTGQCNPSQDRLSTLTGYGKRTVVFELQALKDLGLVEWIRGWGNMHGTVSSRYTLNLSKMKELGADESAAVSYEGAAVAYEGAAVASSKCTPCTLTSKEPPILEPPRFEPSASLFSLHTEKREFTAGEGETPKDVLSAPHAPSYESAPDASSSVALPPVPETGTVDLAPFAGLTESQLVNMLPHNDAMQLYYKYDEGAGYKTHRTELIAAVIEYQKTQEVTA